MKVLVNTKVLIQIIKYIVLLQIINSYFNSHNINYTNNDVFIQKYNIQSLQNIQSNYIE